MGGGAGAVGGAAGGAALGSVLGSVVPGPGTILGGAIGGAIGFVAGGAAAAGAGAGIGAARSSDKYKIVKAVDAFAKLKDFSFDKNHNTCYCTVVGNTTCPFQEYRLRRN